MEQTRGDPGNSSEMFCEDSCENSEWTDAGQETEETDAAPENNFEASSGGDVQDLIHEIGELQIKKGFLLSKLEKLQGRLGIVQHTQSIEPALENLCAQRAELYNGCVILRQEVQGLRAVRDELEADSENFGDAGRAFSDTKQIRNSMACFKPYEALRMKICRVRSAMNSEAAKCRDVMMRVGLLDEIQERLVSVMDEISGHLEYFRSTGYNLEDLEAMSDIDLKRAIVSDLGSQLESLRGEARVSLRNGRSGPREKESSAHELDCQSTSDFSPENIDVMVENSPLVPRKRPRAEEVVERSTVAFDDDVECHVIPPGRKRTRNKKARASRRKSPRKKSPRNKSPRKKSSRKKSPKRAKVVPQDPETSDFPDLLGDVLPSGDLF